MVERDDIPGVVLVSDPADPRLADYERLTDVGHRVRREPAAGVFIAEGATVLQRALDAGFTPRSLLLAPNRVEPAAALAAAVAEHGAPVYVAGADLLERLTGYHVHRGLLAAMGRRPLPEIRELLAGARRVVVCEDIVDHTNLGALFRCAAGFGIDAVLVTPSCADPLYRRAIRTSMGTVFAVPWTRLQSWPADLALLRAAGFTVAALSPGTGTGTRTAVELAEFAAAAPERIAWVVGTEGDGLAPATIEQSDMCVHIGMEAGVDSLNVAAAAAVAFYATR
ncbi:RNA methyltransferase [Sporichthya sp.]|uniref:TrmH family RNA methyltransferase n=1 Tax=Sporichthya sp. TaxID=65475 RepID=UPI0025F59D2B|nr:RNA methyltransferase [Sporichthya sp.]